MPNRRFFLVLMTVLAAAQGQLAGQVLPFHRYTTKDGLLSNRILTMVQDSRGYLWIGTADGLSVFDGVTFKNYTVADGLSGSFITRIAESKRTPGTMWIGTLEGGLSRFEHGMFQKMNFDTPSPMIASLMEASDGTLWCGTGKGVLQMRDGAVTRLTDSSFSGGDIDIVEGDGGMVYVLYATGLFRFSEGKEPPQRVMIDLAPGTLFEGLYKDTYGNLWVASSDSTLYRLHGSVPAEKYRTRTKKNTPFVVDGDGDFWLGNLFRVPRAHRASGKFIQYSDDNGLPDDEVYPLLIDTEEDIWFGSWDNGLIKLSEKHVFRFPSKIHDSKSAVVLDGNGRLWGLATDGLYEYWHDSDGLWHMNHHHLEKLPERATNGSAGAFVGGLLWIGCGDGTIRGYTVHPASATMPSTLSLTKKISFLHESNKNLLTFFPDREKRLWCVLGGTIAIVDVGGFPRIVRRIGSPPLPWNVFVNALWEDRHKNIWIGDYSLGLFLLRPDDDQRYTLVHYTQGEGLPDNNIRSLAEDRDGHLWIGTRYGGVAMYEEGMFTTLTMKEGLLSNHVRSIARDSSGAVWLGTSLGPIFIRGERGGQIGWNSELLGNLVNVCGIHPEGFLWFATSTGLTVYDYSRHHANSLPPPVHITGFSANGKVQDVQGSPGLSYQQNNCVIDYVGISLRDENGVRYRFRLQGIDTAWGELTSRRSVTYASLPPGSYRFEVQAINADGISSTRPAVLSFSILPPFWQRWWFLVGAALALLLAFGSIVRYISTQRLLRRVQVLEREHAVQIERERTRDRIARDLHDDVASTLGSVVIYSESLKRRIQKDSESSDLTERISALSLEAQEALGDIVWSTSPTHDTLKELLTRIRDIASETCSARGIRYDISLPAEIPDITLAEEIRKSIFLIFKEAMNNVLKHAKAARVQITASLSGGRLRLVIIDDGMGIGGEAGNGSHRGHGLRNMAHRAKEIGAQFAVRSEPGKGTTIDMSYKMT